MKSRLLLILIALIAAFAINTTHTAHAAADFVTLTFTGDGTCTDSSFTAPITLSRSLSTYATYGGTAKINGITVSTEVNTLIDTLTSSYNFRIRAFPTSVSQPYFINIVYTFTQSGSTLSVTDVTFRCSDGIAILQGPSIPGPGIPSGFLLRMITCDTAVFNFEGNPIGSNAVKAGQSFFISTTVTMIDDASYTELFAGSYSNGFIPSACIGDKPEGYTGA